MNTINDITQKLKPVLEKYGVRYAGVFGSAARGQTHPKSDIDLLVKFNHRVGFFTLYDFEQEAESALNAEVDVITEGGVGKYLKPEIDRDLVLIYGQK